MSAEFVTPIKNHHLLLLLNHTCVWLIGQLFVSLELFAQWRRLLGFLNVSYVCQSYNVDTWYVAWRHLSFHDTFFSLWLSSVLSSQRHSQISSSWCIHERFLFHPGSWLTSDQSSASHFSLFIVSGWWISTHTDWLAPSNEMASQHQSHPLLVFGCGPHWPVGCPGALPSSNFISSIPITFPILTLSHSIDVPFTLSIQLDVIHVQEVDDSHLL